MLTAVHQDVGQYWSWSREIQPARLPFLPLLSMSVFNAVVVVLCTAVVLVA